MAFSGSELRAIRKRGGWSRTDLAYKVRCSAAAITHYELGNRRPSPAMVERIAEALHVEVGDLYDHEDTPA